MALALTKNYTFSAGTTISSSEVNADFDTLYNAFSSIESKSSTLSNLVVDTLLKSTGTIESANGTNSAPSFSFTGRTNTGIYSGASGTLSIASGGSKTCDISSAAITPTVPILAPAGSIAAPSYSFAATTNTGFTKEPTGNAIAVTVSGTQCLIIYGDNFQPVGTGAVSSGGASAYWGDISYKTLTDRGCLGCFDEGVELQNGTKVSDTEALLAIKEDPKKLTIYGVPMLDYRTFPKVSYKRADSIDGLLPRDENDDPIGGSDGIEMTSMFSIMIGAIKELTNRVKVLEKV